MTNQEALRMAYSKRKDSAGEERDFFNTIIQALEQTELDLISRKAAIEAVKKNTFRLTFAEEQNCEGHVAWSAKAVYSDDIEGALLELPSIQPESKKDGDTISKQDVLDEINRIGVKAFETYADYSELFDFVDSLPSVNQQESKYCDRNICLQNDYNGTGCNECEVAKSQSTEKTGRWIESNGVGMFVCSVCNDSFYPMPTCMGKPLMKYCPNCGAKMEVEQ